MAAVGEDIAAKLRRLMDARTKRDETKVAAERAEKEYRANEAELWEELEDSPMAGLNFPVNLGEPYGIVRFQPRETYYGRVIDKDAALEYFEKRAMVDEVTEPKIVMARVNEIVRDHMESGKSLPAGLDFYGKRFISITRQKD